jgi:hypothetical protein
MGRFSVTPPKLAIFLPAGLIVAGLWATGAWMWVWPILNRRRVRLSKQTKAATVWVTGLLPSCADLPFILSL